MVAPQAADGSGDADTHTAAPQAEGGSRDPQTHIWWPLRLRAVPAMGKVWQHLELWPLLSGAAVTSDYKSDLCSLLLPPEVQALLCSQTRLWLRTGAPGTNQTGVNVGKGCESDTLGKPTKAAWEHQAIRDIIQATETAR